MKQFIPIAQYKAKYIGALLILFVITIEVVRLLGVWDLSSVKPNYFAVCLGLVLIFFSKEKDEKEEYIALRMNALALAVLFAFFTLPFLSFYFAIFIKDRGFMTAYEFLIMLLAAAIGLFYYLKAKSKKDIVK